MIKEKLSPNMNKIINILGPLLPSDLIVDGNISSDTLFEFDGNFEVRDSVGRDSVILNEVI